jgi:hypothetical protein
MTKANEEQWNRNTVNTQFSGKRGSHIIGLLYLVGFGFAGFVMLAINSLNKLTSKTSLSNEWPASEFINENAGKLEESNRAMQARLDDTKTALNEKLDATKTDISSCNRAVASLTAMIVSLWTWAIMISLYSLKTFFFG